MRPVERLAVDVLLEQPLAHHQREVAPHAPPGRIGRLVDDVAEVVQPARVRGLAGPQPFLARLPALPGAGGEAEDLDLHAAALERPRQDVGAGRRHRDRTAAHRAGIVEEERHDGVAERGLALLLEGERRERIDDHPRQPRRDRECPPPGRSPRRGSAARAGGAAGGWPAAPPRRAGWRAACRGRRAAGRAPPAGRDPPHARSRRAWWKRSCSRSAARSGREKSGRRASPDGSLSAAAVVLREVVGRGVGFLRFAGLFFLAGRFRLLLGGFLLLLFRLAARRLVLLGAPSASSSASSSSSASGPSSSPMSSEVRRSRTASAKACWSSAIVPSRSSSLPAFVSIASRQSSTTLRALFGGGAPVSRSRTMSATASSIGASDCSVISSRLARW